MKLLQLPSFAEWLSGLGEKTQFQVDARLLRIREHGHFGDAKDLGDGLAELRWKSGLRIYFARAVIPSGEQVLLILGGNKNGQSKDIGQARLLLRKYAQGLAQAEPRDPRLRPF